LEFFEEVDKGCQSDNQTTSTEKSIEGKNGPIIQFIHATEFGRPDLLQIVQPGQTNESLSEDGLLSLYHTFPTGFGTGTPIPVEQKSDPIEKPPNSQGIPQFLQVEQHPNPPVFQNLSQLPS
jgi:hypothetical protein